MKKKTICQMCFEEEAISDNFLCEACIAAEWMECFEESLEEMISKLDG